MNILLFYHTNAVGYIHYTDTWINKIKDGSSIFSLNKKMYVKEAEMYLVQCMCLLCCVLSSVWLFVTPWTVAC